MIFDSHYDPYRGVVSLARLFDGELKKGDRVRAMGSDEHFELLEVGCYSPEANGPAGPGAGESGLRDRRPQGHRGPARRRHRYAGRTTRLGAPARLRQGAAHGLLRPLPTEGDDFERLRDALAKLQLNDASLFFEPENSRMGFGFRCGFLGLLHMEIIQERLEREFDLDLIASSPSVRYEVVVDGEVVEITNPSELPEALRGDPGAHRARDDDRPKEYVGAVMGLCHEKRGVSIGMEYISTRRVQLTYDLPLAEIITDFFDALKSRTKGYASYDYEPGRLRDHADLVKVEVLVSGETVDALSIIVHRDKAYQRGRALVEKLKELIPRQQFEVPVQAAMGKRSSPARPSAPTVRT